MTARTHYSGKIFIPMLLLFSFFSEQSAHAKQPTLTEWTKECFESLPEIYDLNLYRKDLEKTFNEQKEIAQSRTTITKQLAAIKKGTELQEKEWTEEKADLITKITAGLKDFKQALPEKGYLFSQSYKNRDIEGQFAKKIEEYNKLFDKFAPKITKTELYSIIGKNLKTIQFITANYNVDGKELTEEDFNTIKKTFFYNLLLNFNGVTDTFDQIELWGKVDPAELLNKINEVLKQYEERAFKNENLWLNKADKLITKDDIFPNDPDSMCHYVQKKEIPIGSNVLFIGDVHGSIHAILRSLWNLVTEKIIDNNFRIIKDKFYLVFLGDYIDRGIYGDDVLYTLCLLKLAPGNWDKVIIIKGNHDIATLDDIDKIEPCTFSQNSMPQKYNLPKWAPNVSANETQIAARKAWEEKTIPFFKTSTFALFKSFPVALFIKSGADFVQCCHGGIAPSYNPTELINTDAEFEKLPSGNEDCLSFFNGDFDYLPGKDENDFAKCEECRKSCGHINSTKTYMQKTGIKAFFRGHNHSYFGLKMMGDNAPDKKNNNYWKNILSAQDQEQNAKDGFICSNYHPVFTFSTASGAQSCTLNCDCYGIATTAKEWKDWTLKVYELKGLPKNSEDLIKTFFAGKKATKNVKLYTTDFVNNYRDARNNKYVKIDLATDPANGFVNQAEGGNIAVHWTDKTDELPAIGKKLEKLAKENTKKASEEEEEEEEEDIVD
ncbi:MAG: metallophosphoesterase [bacterium]